jgi:hypothetical protein
VTLDGIASGAFADKNAAKDKAVTVSGNTISGFDAGNYNLVQPSSLKADIAARTLTAILIGEIKKIYDGNNAATLAAANYQLGNFAGNESASVNKATGTYDSANVVGASSASARLDVGDFTAGSGTALSNYVLPVSAKGDASIAARTLTAILTGEIKKIYDGNNTATLAAANYQLGNFAGNESASVSKTTGTYNSANVVGASSASTKLEAADFTAANATLLSNYSLPTSASGNAGITAKMLTIDAIANNKVYDGNAIATLAGAGGGAVKINGLVGGETLSLSGQFDNKNVGNGKAVTVNGVALTGDTGLASNYTVTQPANLKADITAVLVATSPEAVVVPVRLPSLAAIMNIAPAVLHLSPQVTVIDDSSVAVDSAVAGASEAKVDNAAELSLNMESAGWSDKIIPSTMLGLNATLTIVAGGLQLNNSSVNGEAKK